MELQTTDVIITGGGLAGLSLAKQLKMADENIDIVILEKRTFPIPDTTAKVGESTVEIGAHYLTDVLQLKEHIQEKHLRKHGLRCFFGKQQDDFSMQDELGVSDLFGIPTYQIERGVLENYLYRELSASGVKIIDGALINNVELENKKQTVNIDHNSASFSYQAPWLVDASGRQELIKKKLGLNKKTDHRGNAIFFRVDKTITVDSWSSNEEWQNRLKIPGKRWLSTNHLMGEGYWCWVIPLGSGATSIGVVIDDQALEKSGIETFDDTMQWLQKEQPTLATQLKGAKLLDYNLIRDYSYGCKKMFSDEGWCLTGEAGAFTDPFYSPGSDFIAINNTFISHLIIQDRLKNDIKFDSALFHIFYDSFFKSTLSLYTHQYGGFGDRRMMGVKLLWDYAYYWGILSVLFYKNTITDTALMRELSPLLMEAQEANKRVQSLLVTRASMRKVLPAKGLFIDQYKVPCLHRFNEILKAGDAIDTRSAIKENVMVLKKLTEYVADLLDEDAKPEIEEHEYKLLGDYRLSIIA